MKLRHRFITAGESSRHVLTLLSGSALAQAIPLLAAPLLSRIYELRPEEFGLLGLLMSVVNPLAVIMGLKYDMAIVLPRRPKDAHALVMIAVVSSFLLALILWPVLYASQDVLIRFFEDERLPEVLALVPPLVLCMGIFLPANYWLQRIKAFRRMSVNKIVQMGGISLFSLFFGYTAIKGGLMWGYLAGWLMVTLLVVFQLYASGFSHKGISLRRIGHNLRQYRNFPLYSMIPAFLSTLALSIPVFLISHHFGNEENGYFNLCRQILFVPASFIAMAFSQVYYERIASASKALQPVWPGMVEQFRMLALLALLMVVVVMLAGPFLFGVAFGAAWSVSGEYARLLIVPVALQFIVIPMAYALPAIGRVRESGLWQAGYFSCVLVLVFIPFRSIEQLLLTYALIESGCFLLYFGLIVYFAKLHDKKLKLRA